jgi:hypothetical protein
MEGFNYLRATNVLCSVSVVSSVVKALTERSVKTHVRHQHTAYVCILTTNADRHALRERRADPVRGRMCD